MKKLEILHEPYIKMLEREYMMYECQGEKSCQPEIQLFRWKDGKPDIRTNEEWEKLYLCITDTEHVICKGICKTQEPVKIPAYAQCECGEKFFLSGQYHGCCRCPGCGKTFSVEGYEVRFVDL